ncbi:MAG: histidine phosphatase family protein [Anaerolineales bacterium]|nr:histidine phosphatase family protein [Anaerolineales bacterium]
MKQLLLVRHSHVAQDPARPSHAWPLSADGRSRAQQLAPHLQPFGPTRIVTSTEPKAAETGQILAAVLGLPLHAAPGLQEHARHGAPYYPTRAAFAAAVAALFRRPEEQVFGEETAVQALRRFAAAVDAQLAAYPDDTLTVVSHGTVLTLFICHHNPQLDPIPFWQSMTLPCAAVLSLPERQLQRIISV